MISTVIPHRVPSPRGLVMNTQTIMQNALIKQKLEEQRENYRKRQEQQQQSKQPQLPQQPHHQMTSPVNSPSKQTLSPTPLAFTPTSVLRKMTAEKELDGANNLPAHLELVLYPAVSSQKFVITAPRTTANPYRTRRQSCENSQRTTIPVEKLLINSASKLTRSRVLGDLNNNSNAARISQKAALPNIQQVDKMSSDKKKDDNINANLTKIIENKDALKNETTPEISNETKSNKPQDTNNNETTVGNDPVVEHIVPKSKINGGGDENSVTSIALSDERSIEHLDETRSIVEIAGSN